MFPSDSSFYSLTILADNFHLHKKLTVKMNISFAPDSPKKTVPLKVFYFHIFFCFVAFFVGIKSKFKEIELD